MNDRIGGVNQAIVVIAVQAKSRRGQVAGKNADPGLQVIVEAGKIQVQLQACHKRARPHVGPWRGSAGSGGSVQFQQVGGDVRADVSSDPVRNIATLPRLCRFSRLVVGRFIA